MYPPLELTGKARHMMPMPIACRHVTTRSSLGALLNCRTILSVCIVAPWAITHQMDDMLQPMARRSLRLENLSTSAFTHL
jgi:hypothetical protein